MIYRRREGELIRSWQLGLQWWRGPLVWLGRSIAFGLHLYRTPNGGGEQGLGFYRWR
jgi:hypothetical protein